MIRNLQQRLHESELAATLKRNLEQFIKALIVNGDESQNLQQRK